LDQLRDLVDDLFAAAAHEPGDAPEQALVRRDEIERALPRHGLDAPDARCNAALGDDLEETDIARAAHVRAAAELGREVAEPEHPHAIAVLVAEERERAGGDRLVVRHLANLRVDVAANLVVD